MNDPQREPETPRGPADADADRPAQPVAETSNPPSPEAAGPQPGQPRRPEGPEGAVGDEAGGARHRNRNRRRGRRGGEGSPDAQPQPGIAIESALLVGEDGQPVLPQPAAEEATATDETAEAAAPAASADDRFAEVISGAYDEAEATAPEAAAEPAQPDKRVLPADPDAPKLHKVLAQAGVGSRREMEQLIADGRLTVNGEPAHVGQRIMIGDQVRLDDRPVRVRIHPPAARVLAYHKPAGEIVTHGDPQHRPTVFRKLPRLSQGKWQSVGRLDLNTEGLLLFTNSGELANQLMHPRFGVEREYAVRVLGTLDDEARARLIEGIELDGQRAALRSIADGGGDGANRWYRVVITEGRNREVRNLFAAVGLTVNRLIRIRYGCVVLPLGLKRGMWVDLSERDLRALRSLVGARSQHGAGPPRRDGHGGGKNQNNRRRAQRGRGADRGPDTRAPGGDNEFNEFAAIPNPLQQTYDRRAIREARQPRREISEDGPIPNPLEQTYDKRFVQKQRGPLGGARHKGGGEGKERQPDPMQTSVGYIGADAFHRKMAGGGGGGGGGGRGRRRR